MMMGDCQLSATVDQQRASERVRSRVTRASDRLANRFLHSMKIRFIRETSEMTILVRRGRVERERLATSFAVPYPICKVIERVERE